MQEGTLSGHTDETLMDMTSAGNVQALDALYGRYARRLFSYLLRMLNYDRQLAEDALQDVFLRIAESPGAFDSSRSFKTWVFCVAHNRCMDHFRRMKRHPENDLGDTDHAGSEEMLK